MPGKTGAPLLRRSLDSMIPFLVGLVLGFLTSVSTFSSRVAALETVVNAHTKSIEGMNGKLDGISDKLSNVEIKLSERTRP